MDTYLARAIQSVQLTDYSCTLACSPLVIRMYVCTYIFATYGTNDPQLKRYTHVIRME